MQVDDDHEAMSGSDGPPGRPLPPLGDPTLLRSVAAVLAGFSALVIGVVLATSAAGAVLRPDPTAPTAGFLAVNIAYSAGLAVLAGYLTAKAAPRAPQAHALALAGVLVFMTSAMLLGSGGRAPPGQPPWYPWLMLVLGPAGVIAGGLLRRRDR